MGLLETVKDVAVLVQKADNIDLMRQVLELQSQAVDMLEENRQLRERVKELEQAAQFAKGLRFETPFFFATDDPVPYCARCWEGEGKAIHLAGSADWDDKRWECFKCHAVYLLEKPLRKRVT